MTFREANQKYYVPLAQWGMIFGIVALCQPWIQWLHAYGVTITLIGLVAFIVVTHIGPEPETAEEDDDDEFPDPVKVLKINENAPDEGPEDRSGIV